MCFSIDRLPCRIYANSGWRPTGHLSLQAACQGISWIKVEIKGWSSPAVWVGAVHDQYCSLGKPSPQPFQDSFSSCSYAQETFRRDKAGELSRAWSLCLISHCCSHEPQCLQQSPVVTPATSVGLLWSDCSLPHQNLLQTS